MSDQDEGAAEKARADFFKRLLGGDPFTEELEADTPPPLRDPNALAAQMAQPSDPDASPSKRNVREETLKTANKLVNGDRNATYGSPDQDFARTATYWQAYLAGVVEREGGGLLIRPHDVAAMMSLLKISRISHSPTKHDHWIDLAGYAACGAETVGRTYGELA